MIWDAPWNHNDLSTDEAVQRMEDWMYESATMVAEAAATALEEARMEFLAARTENKPPGGTAGRG